MSPLEQKQALEILMPMLERFEGVRLRPYLCPAGVPTIGLGSTRYEDGRPVRLADSPITRARALEIAQHQLEREYLPRVLELCPGVDTSGRLAALTDFAYNLGTGALRASTLRRRVLAGRWDLVPGELRKWCMAGGRRLTGLALRREAECRLVA